MKVIPLKIENEAAAKVLMRSLGVAKQGIEILSSKEVFAVFKIEGISSWEANIIKQYLLSLGSDAAINREALIKKIKTSILVFGNISQLRKLCDKLNSQPFNLKEVSAELLSALENVFKQQVWFKTKNKIFKIQNPVICGIVNLTPDSFSGDGIFNRVKGYPSGILRTGGSGVKDLVLKKVELMVKHGAKIIDLGGESSRPFSSPVKEEEEIKRVIPVLKALRKEFKEVLISIDTYKYNVARLAVNEGVDIINDITALNGDKRMVSLVEKYKVACVLMHMKGSPKTMQIKPKYKDVTEEITRFFEERLEFCNQRGIDKERIILDPGIGFGKRVEDNFKIIKELYKFKVFGRPIFLGISRKSFIGKALGAQVNERLIGTLSASIISAAGGGDIFRTHDVVETNQAFKIISKIYN